MKTHRRTLHSHRLHSDKLHSDRLHFDRLQGRRLKGHSLHRRKHRGAASASTTHARAGITALGAVITVITVVLVTVGSVFAPSGAANGKIHRYPIKIIRGTKTVTATATVTATVPGPTATVTATKTVPGPTATVTVTGPTVTATGPTGTPSTSPTGTPTTGTGVTSLTDFNEHSAGLYLAAGGLLGAGVDRTIYRLTAGTSTKTDPSTGTNQLKLMRAGGTSSGNAATVDLGGFTVQGTDQMPSLGAYGGIVVGYGYGSRVHDVKVTGIPGYASRPPGETFSLALFHSDSAHLSNVTLDGNRTSDGKSVGATLLGYNYTTGNHTITNLHANHAAYGFGIAMFQAAGTYTFDGGCDLSHNRKAINIEQSIGGTVYNFNGCDFRGTSGAPFVAQVSSINSSSTVYFRDPVVDSWPLKVNCYRASDRNKQLDSDIHLIVNGKDVSNNPDYLQITHL